MTKKRFTTDNGSHEDVCLVDNLTKKEYESNFEDMVSLMNDIWNQTQRFEKHNQRLEKENEQLKIRNKGKQAFIDKQDKIIRLLYNQCKDFKEILDDSNITYPIDERLNKFFEEGVKL